MAQTALHDRHLQAKTKMITFQGWQTPLQFSDLPEEYHAVRAAAGLFDVGYLGRVEVSGSGSTALLQKILTRNIKKSAVGSSQYNLICNESGFILDTVFVFHLAPSRFLITTNALNTGKILLWLEQYATNDTKIVDNTPALAQFALQGPRSGFIIEQMTPQSLKKMPPNAVRETTLQNLPVVLSRTGYTGEHGYEIFVTAENACAVWDAILIAGRSAEVKPCGMLCRDILRLEMGYPQYGNELDETRDPFEAGLGVLVDFKKEFIGKEALTKMKNNVPDKKLVGFKLLDRGIPKNGGSIYSESREIGVVTSGGTSPRHRDGFGLGYVVNRYAQPGQEIEIEIRDKEITARIVEVPFLRKQ